MYYFFEFVSDYMIIKLKNLIIFFLNSSIKGLSPYYKCYESDKKYN